MNATESPFIFGRKAVGNSFTDREQETARLISNFRNRLNTILISPRRWGKSSLVKKAGDLTSSESLKVIFIDAFSLRDATQFYTVLATEVIKGTSNTIETWVEHVKRFFSRLSPRFSWWDGGEKGSAGQEACAALTAPRVSPGRPGGARSATSLPAPRGRPQCAAGSR